tara:strand:- start:2090 stop:2242 length:153 start_codon:yes stop_codon:yes gene_type:complete
MSNKDCTSYDYTNDECKNEYCEDCQLYYNQMGDESEKVQSDGLETKLKLN